MTDEALWDWAVRVYALPGAKSAFLGLQNDYDLDINLILWRVWLADRGRAPDDAVAHAAVALSRGWRDATMRPMRAARDALAVARPPIDAAAANDLRARLLKVELDAEKLHLDALETLASNAPARAGAAPLSAALVDEAPELAADPDDHPALFSTLFNSLATR